MKIKEKISNFLSGSVEEASAEVPEVPEPPEVQEVQLESLVENFDKLVEEAMSSNETNAFEELLGEMWLDKELQEYGTPDVYMLKKPDHGEYHWLVEYKTKMITPVKPSSEVIPVISLGDDKFVCWVGKTQYVVSASIMTYVGDN